MGDIGEFFPPEDKRWKNANSAELLKTVWEKMRAQGWVIENIDCVIIIEKPKILPYRSLICNSIAGILEVNPARIFVKAKTGEGIGIIGRGKAVAALVSSLISCQNIPK